MAGEAVSKYGDALVGRIILTQDWANGYEGNLTKVTRLYYDPGAPEIVFQVEDEDDEVGVFEYEQIAIINE